MPRYGVYDQQNSHTNRPLSPTRNSKPPSPSGGSDFCIIDRIADLQYDKYSFSEGKSTL